MSLVESFVGLPSDVQALPVCLPEIAGPILGEASPPPTHCAGVERGMWCSQHCHSSASRGPLQPHNRTAAVHRYPSCCFCCCCFCCCCGCDRRPAIGSGIVVVLEKRLIWQLGNRQEKVEFDSLWNLPPIIEAAAVALTCI